MRCVAAVEMMLSSLQRMEMNIKTLVALPLRLGESLGAGVGDQGQPKTFSQCDLGERSHVASQAQIKLNM